MIIFLVHKVNKKTISVKLYILKTGTKKASDNLYQKLLDDVSYEGIYP